MKHQLPKLPFSSNALEPIMSKETFNYHHGKHHKDYVSNVNELIQGTSFENSTLEHIIKFSKGSLYNNAAQAWNHAFFWNCLTPTSQEKDISIGLSESISDSFGSLDGLKDEFRDKALKHFGSGWVWLIADSNSILSIETTSNAESPLTFERQPILTCDLWEHAYYIDYRNQRAKFLDGFFKILNWKFVSSNFESIVKLAAA